jgi:carbonic anhydrase
VVVVVGFAASGVPAAAGPPTALESLARLKAGNAKFVSSPESALPIDGARRTALAQGQSPFASVLSCADSRVPPEVIFHASLGDLFVVRAAGNITDRAILASIEYGAEHLHSPLIVVMGHEFCGAVKAAIETPTTTSLGVNLDFLLKAIRPSVSRVASTPEAGRLRAAILTNVEETVNDLLTESTILREMSREKAVTLVGAYYELTTGRVYFSEPAPPAAPGPR